MQGLPPGPRLPVMLQTALLWTWPKRYLGACRRRYGPTFSIRDRALGTIVYVSDPADIKAVFTGDPAVFHAGEGNALLAPVMGERSVLLLDEDEHLRERKRMLPPFHGEAVKRYGEVIEAVVDEEVERWPRDRPFALHPRMRAVTLEVILRAVIGSDDPELRRMLAGVADAGGPVMLMWVLPWLRRFGPWRRYEQTLARADELLYAEIARRRVDPRLRERTDVLSTLICAGDDPMTDRELRDELVTLLLAGHETTATALAWAFERLLRHPHALERLRSGDRDYLDAVVKETLRVRPVIFDVARTLTQPVDLAGFRLPAGIRVMPAIGLVQSSPSLWPEPEAFAPERFLDGETPPYAWIPFGGGRRRCLGAAFATYELKLVLSRVLQRVELRAASPEPEPLAARHITLVPGRGCRVVVTAVRDAPHAAPPKDLVHTVR